MISDLKIALSNLRTARWRSFLTMLGIIVGIASVVTVFSLGEGLKRQLLGQIDELGTDLITVRPGKLVSRGDSGQVDSLNPLALLGTTTLSEQDVIALQRSSSLQAVLPMSLITNTARSSNEPNREINDAFIIGTTAELPQLIKHRIPYGEFFTAEQQDRNYAVIGSSVAARLFNELNPVGQSVNLAGGDFVVRGVFEPFSSGIFSTIGADLNNALFIPYDSAKKVTQGRSQIFQILVQKKPGIGLESAVASTRGVLLVTHQGREDFSVLRQEELLDISSGIINLAAGFISAVAAISLLVGGVGIMNVLLAGVSERTREIGIRKAIGATNRQILQQYLMEGVVLSFVGSLVGLGVALAANFLLRVYTSLKPVISPSIILVAVGVAFAIGVIFSAAPAFKAARKDPIDALRNV